MKIQVGETYQLVPHLSIEEAWIFHAHPNFSSPSTASTAMKECPHNKAMPRVKVLSQYHNLWYVETLCCPERRYYVDSDTLQPLSYHDEIARKLEKTE